MSKLGKLLQKMNANKRVTVFIHLRSLEPEAEEYLGEILEQLESYGFLFAGNDLWVHDQLPKQHGAWSLFTEIQEANENSTGGGYIHLEYRIDESMTEGDEEWSQLIADVIRGDADYHAVSYYVNQELADYINDCS
ncbi:hypothetical protein G7A66_02840 [Altererythrobacter sp. SALINAS58]|uniref:hypothetical protein n=1 Tax=Alteripontixanthobacter muriae TaxID=2705546 RepID=UPI001574FCB3|nr:hypothetical protein [Alteripontixanthobacter muriae]NTZ42046.1 hypothetical protein [Alteripontixanthobacter muriae]